MISHHNSEPIYQADSVVVTDGKLFGDDVSKEQEEQRAQKDEALRKEKEALAREIELKIEASINRQGEALSKTLDEVMNGRTGKEGE